MIIEFNEMVKYVYLNGNKNNKNGTIHTIYGIIGQVRCLYKLVGNKVITLPLNNITT